MSSSQAEKDKLDELFAAPDASMSAPVIPPTLDDASWGDLLGDAPVPAPSAPPVVAAPVLPPSVPSIAPASFSGAPAVSQPAPASGATATDLTMPGDTRADDSLPVSEAAVETEAAVEAAPVPAHSDAESSSAVTLRKAGERREQPAATTVVPRTPIAFGFGSHSPAGTAKPKSAVSIPSFAPPPPTEPAPELHLDEPEAPEPSQADTLKVAVAVAAAVAGELELEEEGSDASNGESVEDEASAPAPSRSPDAPPIVSVGPRPSSRARPLPRPPTAEPPLSKFERIFLPLFALAAGLALAGFIVESARGESAPTLQRVDSAIPAPQTPKLRAH